MKTTLGSEILVCFAIVLTLPSNASAYEAVCYFRNQDVMYASRKFDQYPSEEAAVGRLTDWTSFVSASKSVPTFSEMDLIRKPNPTYRDPRNESIVSFCMNVDNLGAGDHHKPAEWTIPSFIPVDYPATGASEAGRQAAAAGTVAGAVIGGLASRTYDSTASVAPTNVRQRPTATAKPSSQNSWAQLLTQGAIDIANAKADATRGRAERESLESQRRQLEEASWQASRQQQMDAARARAEADRLSWERAQLANAQQQVVAPHAGTASAQPPARPAPRPVGPASRPTYDHRAAVGVNPLLSDSLGMRGAVRTYGVQVTNTGNVTLHCDFKVQGDQARHGSGTCQADPSNCVHFYQSRGTGLVLPGQSRVLGQFDYYLGRGSYEGGCRSNP